ncbi:hypothetical protein BDV93DRAFT_557360 [Ceratobasidium sp. AG-I]|nr:hypothetical protein BDV93DRAFT_557360 [Ceratobasidium sp. AG-I]
MDTNPTILAPYYGGRVDCVRVTLARLLGIGTKDLAKEIPDTNKAATAEEIKAMLVKYKRTFAYQVLGQNASKQEVLQSAMVLAGTVKPKTQAGFAYIDTINGGHCVVFEDCGNGAWLFVDYQKIEIQANIDQSQIPPRDYEAIYKYKGIIDTFQQTNVCGPYVIFAIGHM